MGSLDTFVGKYIRLTDDLHEMRAYLNDIRICFIALTVSCYVGIVMYAFLLCFKRRGAQDQDSSDGTRTTRFPRNSQVSRRSNSRFDGSNYDAEAGGGAPPPPGAPHGNTNEWDDMMPPPPNGSAVKTLDGYRYRHPASTRGNTNKSPFQTQNRLSMVCTDTLDPNLLGGGGKRQSLIIDNHTGTAALVASTPTGGLYQPIGRRSPSEHAFRDGFIEKSPSIT